MLKLMDKKIFTSVFCTKIFCLSGPIEAVVHAVRIHCRALCVLVVWLSLSCVGLPRLRNLVNVYMSSSNRNDPVYM